MKRTFKESIQATAVKQALKYVNKDPEENIPKIIKWVERYDTKGTIEKQLNMVKAAMADPDNNWNVLVKSLFTDIDDEVRMRLFENFIINATMIGSPHQIALSKEKGCNVPWAMLIDPTSACNLHCTGCWAAD